jgi:hypothetical protein
MFTFIYCNPDGMVTEFSEVTKEAARDAAQLAFFQDYRAGKWQGVATEGCITEDDTAGQVINDAPEEGKTYALTGDSDTNSIANGNTWGESEVSQEPAVLDYSDFMNDASNADEAPDVDGMATRHEETNDVLEAATEAMNPVEPASTFKGGWGSGVGGESNHSESRTVDYGTVSEVAVERQTNHDSWLAELGLSRPTENISITKAGYQRGTAVVDIGYDTLKAARVVWDEKPDAYDAASQFVEAIRREGREDYDIHLDKLRMNDDGMLMTNVGMFSLEENAMRQLLTATRHGSNEDMTVADGPLFPRGFHVMKGLDPDVRAYVFNEHMKRHGVLGKGMKIRTRINGSNRSVFGVVGTGYASYDADKVAQMVSDSIEGMPYKAEIKYNSDTTNFTMDVTMHAPGNLTDFSAGDLYEVGFRFKSNDRGGGSINGSAIAFWNECLNMIVLHSEKNEIMRAIHKGAMAEKMEAIRDGIAKGRPAMERFAKDWGILGSVPMDTFLSEDDYDKYSIPGHAEPDAAILIRKMVTDGNLGDGFGRDAIVQMVLESYNDQGGGETAQDFINAVTRSAHQHLVDDCARDVLEREAGLLVPMMAQVAIA